MTRPLLLLTLLVACSSSGPAPTTPAPSPPVPSPPPSLARAYERPCEESVFGTLGAHWRDRSLVVGPIAFVGLPAGAAEGSLGVHGTRAYPQKVLAVVDRGGPVTVSVAPEARAFAGLLYDPHRFPDGRVGLASTDVGVTFHPCGGDQRRTQFNGGILVLRPGCVVLDVSWPDGHRRVPIPFAGASCE